MKYFSITEISIKKECSRYLVVQERKVEVLEYIGKTGDLLQAKGEEFLVT